MPAAVPPAEARDAPTPERATFDHDWLTQAVAEHGGDIIFAIDQEHKRFVSSNAAAEAAYGYTREELLTMGPADVRAPESLGGLEAQLRAAAGGAVYETLHRRRDGTLFPVEVSSVTAQVGGVPVLLSVVRDVSARKRAEAEQARSTELLRTAFRAIPWPASVSRASDAVFVEVNEATQRMFGRTREELIGRSSIALNAWVDPADRLAIVRSLRDGEDVIDREVALRSSDGRVAPYLVSALPITMFGEPHVLFVSQDITERRAKECELRTALAAAERFRDALDHVPAYVYMKDLESRYTYANRPTLELFGVTEETLAGAYDVQFFPPESAERLRAIDQRVMQGQPTQEEVEILGPARDLRTYVEVKSPLYDRDRPGEPTGLLGISIDITERKQTDEKIRRLGDFYAALAACNEAIARSTDEAVLFEEICRIAVTVGGVEMAWIGRIDADGRRVQPVASYGDADGFLADITITLGPDEPHGQGPSACAIRNARPSWSVGFDQQIEGSVWRERAARSGWRSAAGLPLMRRGVPVGVFTLYARETDAFSDDVRRLLVDMAADISYALDDMAREEERKRAVAALGDSEERYRQIFDHMVSGLAVFEVVRDAAGAPFDHRFLYGNAAFDQLTGLRAAELRGVDGRRFPMKWRSEHVQRMYEIAAGSPPLLFEYHDAESGRTYDTRVFSPRAGQFAHSFTEVTDRKRAEAALRLESAALAAAANVIVITNRDGVIEWANDAFVASTGYTLAQAAGRTPGELLRSGAHDAAFYAHLWQTILSGNVWHGEMHNRRSDGTLFTEDVTITPVRDDQGAVTHFIAVKQDITERKALEEQYRHAQKMESVGRLAGGVAHDFNNMLSVILGQTELALLQLDRGSPLYAGLHEVQVAAQRSADLTRHLLAFARRQTVTPRVLDVDREVSNSLKLLQRLISEDIALRWLPAGDLHPVFIDPAQLDQILANLCINARDAIAGLGAVASGGAAPGGGGAGGARPRDAGAITLSTADCVLDEAFCLAHPEASPGEYVRLTVRDNGCGMTRDVMANIFEPFFTTKPVGEGTGLGLATVYGAVRQNGGCITVASEPGVGTAFDVYLPQHLAPVEVEAVAGPAAVPHGTETILLVEDERSLLLLARKTLEQLGYTVLAAPGPKEAIRLAAAYPGTIHLLLTDVIMPEMNGRQLAALLVSSRPALKCIFMSGYTADVIAGMEIINGTMPFVAKPFSRRALAAKVRLVLDGAVTAGD